MRPVRRTSMTEELVVGLVRRFTFVFALSRVPTGSSAGIGVSALSSLSTFSSSLSDDCALHATSSKETVRIATLFDLVMSAAPRQVARRWRSFDLHASSVDRSTCRFAHARVMTSRAWLTRSFRPSCEGDPKGLLTYRRRFLRRGRPGLQGGRFGAGFAAGW
jgi:hypothetical protein